MEQENLKRTLVFSDSDQEIRVALLEGEELSEIFFEDMEADRNSGKIFIGRIENEVKSLEAFFVNIGMKKNGFLRFKDLVGLPNEFRKGDLILVQVRKDGTNRKGPQLSMQINLPGRYVVYMPYGEGSIGISRRITEQEERDRIREIAEEIIYETEGIIFRTNCQGVDRETIEEEIKELRNKMRDIVLDFNKANKPDILYSEEDFVEYVIRERIDNKTKKIVVDSRNLYKKIDALLEEFEHRPSIEIYDRDSFNYKNIYEQLDDIFARKIPLKSGGTITIDKAEAMTVIDVDSASNIKGNNVEETSFSTNREAAYEITRQMRLRNLAGIIIVDFIDMNKPKHREEIINIIHSESKKDKARVTIVGFTHLGLLEITRKRTSAAIESLVFTPCPICHGTGRVAAPAVVYNRMIKDIEDSLNDLKDHNIKEITISVYHNLSGYVTPEIRKNLESKHSIKINFEFNWNDPNSYNIRFKK